MSDLLNQVDVRVAVVVIGESVTASLLRSASRGVVSGHPRLRLGERPEPACQWLGEELGIDRNELDAALREARAVAERALAAPP